MMFSRDTARVLRPLHPTARLHKSSRPIASPNFFTLSDSEGSLTVVAKKYH
jgi:hypothetical protein